MTYSKFIALFWNEKRPEFLMGVFASLVGGGVLVLLSIAFKGNVMLSIIAGLLLALFVLVWFHFPYFRVASRIKALTDQVPFIPKGNDDNEWKRWTHKTTSILRGMGLAWKARVLRRMIQQASPDDRAVVAEGFLQGLANDKIFLE